MLRDETRGEERWNERCDVKGEHVSVAGRGTIKQKYLEKLFSP